MLNAAGLTDRREMLQGLPGEGRQIQHMAQHHRGPVPGVDLEQRTIHIGPGQPPIPLKLTIEFPAPAMEGRAVGLQTKGRSLGWVVGLTTIKKPLLTGPRGLFRRPGHLQEGEISLLCQVRLYDLLPQRSLCNTIQQATRRQRSGLYLPSPDVLQPGVDGLDLRRSDDRGTRIDSLPEHRAANPPHQAQALGQQDITALKVGTKGGDVHRVRRQLSAPGV